MSAPSPKSDSTTAAYLEHAVNPDSALKMGLSVIFVAMKLFPSAHELCDALRSALDVIDPPDPAEETPPQRANGSGRRRTSPPTTG